MQTVCSYWTLGFWNTAAFCKIATEYGCNWNAKILILNVQNYDLASLQSALSWQSKQLVAKSLQISDPERAGDASNEAVCGGAKYLCWTPSLFIKEIASQSWLKIIYDYCLIFIVYVWCLTLYDPSIKFVWQIFLKFMWFRKCLDDWITILHSMVK